MYYQAKCELDILRSGSLLVTLTVQPQQRRRTAQKTLWAIFKLLLNKNKKRAIGAFDKKLL